VLTIAVPTYNRAALLDRQLEWLAAAVRGYEDRLELVVSDNCSSDATPEVAARWQRTLGAELLQVRRQAENVGAIRNIESCLVQAGQRHVWAISDDDVLSPSAVAQVLTRLQRHPDLGLLTLNFSSRSGVTGEQRFARCYQVDGERVRPDGGAAFTEMLAEDWGGVALTTAQVYRSDLLRGAVEAWGPYHVPNLVVQMFWTGWCAAHGDVLVTEDPLLECTADTHFFLADPMLHLRLGFADVPELAERLAELGYPWPVLRGLVLRQLAPHQVSVVRRAARADPRATAAVLKGYLRAVRRVGLPATASHLRRKVTERLGERSRH
jgi:abequosyltransferase